MVGLRVNNQEHPRKGTAIKTVRLFALAMADIASAAREVLLAMSVTPGMAVMQEMFEAEITEACGPQGKQPGAARGAPGAEKGSIIRLAYGRCGWWRPAVRDRRGRA